GVWMLNRRRFLGAGAAALLGSPFLASCAREVDFGPLAGTFHPDTKLLDAARKEGGLVFYTAGFLEPEQAVTRAFSKRFEGVNIELMRAPTGQMVTRIKTEAAARKLAADVIDISDRVMAQGLIEVFGDYTPPNAADFPITSYVPNRLWPRTSNAWTIAYNAVL